MPPYIGLLIAEALLGMGGGFTEVLISPLMEACPTEGKSGNMSLLHSFYCWGQASVVLFSGIFFYFLPIADFWYFLPFLWAIIPLIGAIAFSIVPIYSLPSDEESKKSSYRRLFSMPLFFCFILMMFCGGASEMTMSQWSSAFAESALGVSKAVGDLLGPCMFALMMGTTRALYGKFSHRLKLHKMMALGCIGCAVSYILAAFAPHPAFALLGCAFCGFSVGIFWPGILSGAAEAYPTGGIAMFAILALAGDLGCLVGPSVAGSIADALGGNLQWAFCFAVAFPILCLITLYVYKKGRNN
jgi:fucose permease